MTNYFLFLTLKWLFESELYNTFQVIYMINIVFCLNFVDNLQKDLTHQQIDAIIQSFHVKDIL